MLNRMQIVAKGKLRVTKDRAVLRSWKDSSGTAQTEYGDERWKVVLGDAQMSLTFSVDPKLKDGAEFELILATKKEDGNANSDSKRGTTGKAGDGAVLSKDKDAGQGELVPLRPRGSVEPVQE
jgi:hypothetical protein